MKRIFPSNSTLCVFISLLFFQGLHAQLQEELLPFSLSVKSQISNKIHGINLSKPNVEALLIEDEADLKLGKAFRFGSEMQYDLSLTKEITPEIIGSKALFRYKIIVPEAKSLGLNFADFSPGKSGKLWVYDSKKETLKGAFTTFKNPNSKTFSIAPVPTEILYLEFVCDTSELPYINLELKSVVYGYKDVFSKGVKGFGASGNCNVNINCPDGDNWQNQKRSVAMILTASNTRICTGALLNNTAEDGKPYFLTAHHCNITANNIIMFNYESPDCSNMDGPLNQTLQGGVIRADYANSDFTLIEMNDIPPVNYSVFYAGWSASDGFKTSGTCIHHPRGDIKKISLELDTLLESAYISGDTSKNHWEIALWNTATTEPGSSGSPLFDQNQRIIGQLHGGFANCANSIQDYYGMFKKSWLGGGTYATSLFHWLDPDSSGVLEINGKDFNTAGATYDLGMENVTGVENSTCKNTFAPKVKIRNWGLNTVEKIRIHYNNQFVDTTISFPPSTSKIFTLPSLELSSGLNHFFFQVEILEPFADEYEPNDSISFTTNQYLGEEITITLQTDYYGTETLWTLSDENGNDVLTGSGFSGSELYQTSYCMPFECYTFRIYDSGSDGICCNTGNGYYKITDSKGHILAEGGQFLNYESKNICVPYFQNEAKAFAIFPNPTTDFIHVQVNPDLLGKNAQIYICDLQGQIIENNTQTLKYLNTFDVSRAAAGVYIVCVRSGNLVERHKFIKK